MSVGDFRTVGGRRVVDRIADRIERDTCTHLPILVDLLLNDSHHLPRQQPPYLLRSLVCLGAHEQRLVAHLHAHHPMAHRDLLLGSSVGASTSRRAGTRTCQPIALALCRALAARGAATAAAQLLQIEKGWHGRELFGRSFVSFVCIALAYELLLQLLLRLLGFLLLALLLRLELRVLTFSSACRFGLLGLGRGGRDHGGGRGLFGGDQGLVKAEARAVRRERLDEHVEVDRMRHLPQSILEEDVEVVLLARDCVMKVLTAHDRLYRTGFRRGHVDRSRRAGQVHAEERDGNRVRA